MLSWVSFNADSLANTASSVYAILKRVSIYNKSFDRESVERVVKSRLFVVMLLYNCDYSSRFKDHVVTNESQWQRRCQQLSLELHKRARVSQMRMCVILGSLEDILRPSTVPQKCSERLARLRLRVRLLYITCSQPAFVNTV